ncbi:MAG: tripartite tricarboxylate transporter substrate binding protein [Rhodocyclaceae bacterium]|jgi:tripartite-type tricarboxylate transporter receptor subunit TctC|nr:tripartite tricarboxylate transporter substrate binding protein [Rhodocyclaceae bacterium]MCA3073093.1 tripartite tricarboxylate transporter substrate binding protein [Rhodocyclaceae bacterium]MCA3091512.1 tripartite tricarboxylate transporter substrate binding protein [Rhodocyclaceae bacterium]MCA3094034.1 tripartite tricarboxylate transporter substrate binding protein [Rhodocyclaceae bacterium]MCA3099175.1 tripartite tricarboxylate transporter substrate binding protein [Rhodocyclaceae bact
MSTGLSTGLSTHRPAGRGAGSWRVPLAALLLAVAPSCLAATAPPAAASWPDRPLRILIPFPPGGASDTIGRTTGDQLAQQLGQPVVIDNRPGAGGRLAIEMLAGALPDGYTTLVGSVGGIAISPSLYRKLPYDPERDLLPVSRIGEIINVMVVNPSIGVASVKDFIEWTRKRTEPVRFGSSGTGQPDHLAAEFFQRAAGVTMTHVPYKGGGPALVDLMSGDLQLMFATYVVALPHVKSGRLRLLGVTTPERQALLPDLSALSEAIPGFGLSNWNGLFLPGRTPVAIAERLFVEANKAILSPELKRRQAVAGIEPVGSRSRAEFAQFVRDDTARWARIVKQSGIVVE